MPRAKAVAIVVLLLSYGAVGARQPAVRTSAPLPVPPDVLASALDLGHTDRARLLLDVVRLVFDAPDGYDRADQDRRHLLDQLIRSAPSPPSATIPLPLDPSIWRETILQRQAADTEIVAAILSERRLALLYHGLAALDDETLAWLGPDRETLHHLLRRPGAFAAFGRSIRVQAGRVVVPGGPEAEPLWETLVGSSVARPGSFVRRLFGSSSGRLAFLFDTIAHLDQSRQRFALGLSRDPAARPDRLRALADLFEAVSADWRVEERPFSRPLLDPSLTLSLVEVSEDGDLAGPADRELWELVFQSDDTVQRRFEAGAAQDEAPAEGRTAVDAAWLLGRLHRAPLALSRQRLETFLFAQRVFPDARAGRAALAAALRAVRLFPALTATLERCGVRSVPLTIAAAARAQSLDDIRHDTSQRTATLAFQASLGIVERSVWSGALAPADAATAIGSLVALDPAAPAYEARIGQWLRRQLLPGLPRVDEEDEAPVENALLAAMAGVGRGLPSDATVEWEGRTYRVDFARGELRRLQRIRQLQRNGTVDGALAAAPDSREARSTAESARAIAESLASILYAAHLGDAGAGQTADASVALRHDFGVTRGAVRTSLAWRLPREEFGSVDGWRVVGSLLGLETALARVALRRLDATAMPSEPKLSQNERQTLFLTAALMTPSGMTDATRDEIAAALGRGRARIEALVADRVEIDRVARDAGLSGWRREALAWTLEHDRERLAEQFSLAEIMWLGSPRQSAAIDLDAWGAAQLPLSGCLCLRMPGPGEWEPLAGRPAAGLLATRAVDVALQVAEVLAEHGLPSSLATSVVAFAMQDVADRARPAYFGDGLAVSAASRTLGRGRIVDYIGAIAAGGPLVPVAADPHRP